MLLPTQVIPFLKHDDPIVRHHALDYLSEAHDPAPATADDVWDALDHLAPNQDETSDYLVKMRTMPQTESFLERLLAALERHQPERIDFHLQQLVMGIDTPLLIAHRDKLLGCPLLIPRVQEHLEQRLQLLDRPVDALWENLIQCDEWYEGAMHGQFDASIPDRIVSALVHHGDAVVPQAMTILDEEDDSWLAIWVVQLLGRLRHEPAVPLLLEKLLLEGDILSDVTVKALSAIGTADVVHQVEAFYPGKSLDVRSYLSTPLECIKRPQSEQALLRLLDVEPDEDLTAGLAEALCMLCTTEGIERVRGIMLQQEFDSRMYDIEPLLLACSQMTGYELPDVDALRKEVEPRLKKYAERRAEISDDLGAQYREKWREGYAGHPLELDPEPDFDTLPSRLAPEPLTPIRNSLPKTGRNDPCPCGSGKKYKKCCGK